MSLTYFTARRGHEDLVDHIWLAIGKADEGCIEVVQINRELVVIATPAKPVVWTDKGTVMRKATMERFRHKIDTLFEALERSCSTQGP